MKYEEMHQNFCSNLKAIRKQKRMTQEDFSKYICIGRSLYTKYETGASPPNFEKLLKIIITLDISADFLFGLKNNNNIDGKLKRVPHKTVRNPF